MDQLVCEKDYKVVFMQPTLSKYLLLQESMPTCVDCSRPITGAYYTLDGGIVVCQQDYQVGGDYMEHI